MPDLIDIQKRYGAESLYIDSLNGVVVNESLLKDLDLYVLGMKPTQPLSKFVLEQFDGYLQSTLPGHVIEAINLKLFGGII